MNCVNVIEVFGDYLENELPGSISDRVDSHLHECSGCRDMFEGYKLVVQLAREIGREQTEIPGEVHQRLRGALNDRLGISLSVAG